MSTTNNHSCLFAPTIMCLVLVFMSTAFTQPYASVIIMTKEELELDKIFDKKLEEMTPNIVAEGILGNNGEIIFLNRKKYVNEYLGFDNIIIVDNKNKTFSLYYIKWPLLQCYGKIKKNGRIDYSHVDTLDFANSKSFSGPKKWPKKSGESVKISELVGEKDWIMINSKPCIIYHIPKNTIGFMYELYNGKLFYPGSNAKMIKTSSLCYVVQTNENRMEIKRCINNTNVCIIENTDDFRPSEITWIDAGKEPWWRPVWPYMKKQNLPVMPDRMLFLSPDNYIIERKYKYINEHGDEIEVIQPISR